MFLGTRNNVSNTLTACSGFPDHPRIVEPLCEVLPSMSSARLLACFCGDNGLLGTSQEIAKLKALDQIYRSTK